MSTNYLSKQTLLHWKAGFLWNLTLQIQTVQRFKQHPCSWSQYITHVYMHARKQEMKEIWWCVYKCCHDLRAERALAGLAEVLQFKRWHTRSVLTNSQRAIIAASHLHQLLFLHRLSPTLYSHSFRISVISLSERINRVGFFSGRGR